MCFMSFGFIGLIYSVFIGGYPKLVAILCSIGLLVVGLTLVYINENEPGMFSMTMTVIGYLLCALFAISFVLNLGQFLLAKSL